MLLDFYYPLHLYKQKQELQMVVDKPSSSCSSQKNSEVLELSWIRATTTTTLLRSETHSLADYKHLKEAVRQVSNSVTPKFTQSLEENF